MSGLDLYQTQRALALLFVYAALLGFSLGVLYDLLRFIRVFFVGKRGGTKQGSIISFSAALSFFSDLVFMVISAISLILLCYYANDGQFRASAMWGIVGGFFVQTQTVGRLTARITEPLAVGIRSFLRRILRMTVKPALWLIRLTVKGAGWLYRSTLGKLVTKKRESATRRITENMIESAAHGYGIMEDIHKG